MKKLLFLFVLLVVLPVISSAETINGLDVEWEIGTGYNLTWTNPAISKGDYVIKVIDFNWKGDAVVSVTRKGVIRHGVLSQGENLDFNFTTNTTYFQGVRIYPRTISNFQSVNASISSEMPVNIGTYPCCPAAEITVQISKDIRKKPVLELVLSPNWDGRSGVASTMNIQIKNTGDANFSEGNVTINISGLKIAYEQEVSDQSLIYNPSKGLLTRGWSTPLLVGNSYNVNLSVKSPIPSNISTFIISVQSYFKDFNRNIYFATESA